TFTIKKIFSPTTIRNCLSMMYSCVMYDFSGEYAFSVGLPAKSGVSGALAISIPNVGGFAIFYPRLDPNHKSVRGVEFS
ncbi:glutaminase, partial [Francisella tularensis subsp. holarctica]|uniref:glutaminase n=1 Tax=Francisella tularensis TaxID=263 RepID=UPI002381C77A